MNRAVFLDRDGTINVDRCYVHTVAEFEYIPGAKEGLRLLRDAGYLLVIVTNQSGIARGMFTEGDYQMLTSWILEDLAHCGVRVAKVCHCPHHPEVSGVCGCRKPATGMFHEAAMELGVDLDASWAVGDNARDLAICAESGCRGVLLTDDEAFSGQLSGIPANRVSAAHDLLEASRLIAKG